LLVQLLKLELGPGAPSDRRDADRLPTCAPLSTGHPGPSQVVAPRRPARRADYRFRLDLAPARRWRVRVSPILASLNTVWRPRTPSVPAVDDGET